jgi:hypothetical protein
MKKRLLEFSEALKTIKEPKMSWLEEWVLYLLRGGVRPKDPH